MHDQADGLRRMVLEAAPTSTGEPRSQVPLIVVAGAARGVGATTIALNLAISLIRQGDRVVLVDSDPRHPALAPTCGIEPQETILDLMLQHRTIPEVLQRGPAGVQIVPGRPLPDNSDSPGLSKLVPQLRCLSPRADRVVIDAGSQPGPALRTWWHAADLILLITTSDRKAILDSYSAIKGVAGRQPAPRVSTVVNLSTPDRSDADLHDRIGRASQRFLGLPIDRGPSIPNHADPTRKAAGGALLFASPSSPAALGAHQLANHVARLLDPHRTAAPTGRSAKGTYPFMTQNGQKREEPRMHTNRHE